MQIVNKFDKRCSKCGVLVVAGAGVAHKPDNGRWDTYCAAHAPERIQVRATVTERKLASDGYITMPYEVANIPLLKTLPIPAGRRSAWDPDKKQWVASMAEQDRMRVLEIADRLGLNVDPSLRGLSDLDHVNMLPDNLYPFQKVGVEWMSRRDRAILGDDMGTGKAQPMSAKILTPTGWKLMGSIQVGDRVIDPTGGETQVTGVFPQGEKEIFRVVFSDGSSTECCGEHLWDVITATCKNRGSSYQTFSLDQIRESGLTDGAGNARHYIPMVVPVEFDAQEVPLDSYLMGYLLGNGNFTGNTPSVSIPDAETVERVGQKLPLGHSLVFVGGIDYYISSGSGSGSSTLNANVVKKVLRDLGLDGHRAEEKFIPGCYLYNSVVVREELLRGLTDSDGSVDVKNNVEFSSSSQRLFEGVRGLVQSLGGVASSASRTPWYTYKGEVRDGQTSYRTSINIGNFNPFRLSRKAGAYKGRPKYGPTRAIKSIESVGKAPAQCIRVASENHLYVTDDYIVTHNTCQALFSLSADDRTLVVCPASLKYNWEAECKRWRPDLTVKVVNSTDGKLPVPKAGEVVVINYDILPKWLLLDRNDMPVAVSKLEGITLVCDEAHFLGNYKSQRSKKVTMLSEKFAKRVLFLTGTAMTRDPKSMWSVLSAAGVAREAFGGWTRYMKLYNAHKDRWGGITWGQPDQTVPELLRRVMLRRTRAEVLPDLPSKTYTNILVNGLSASLRSTLDSVWSDQGDFLTTEDCLPDFSEFSKVRAELAAAKIPALLELVEEHETQGVPLVVGSDHLGPIEVLENRPGWAVIKGGVSPLERQRIVEAFQNGTLKGVGLTIGAGGVGITLTHAWKMICVDLSWTPANNAQLEDRLVRIGQQAAHVEIVRLVVSHPLEAHIHSIIAKKTAMVQASIENSVQAQKATASKAVNGSVQSETSEEYNARMAALALAAEEIERQAQEEAAQGRKQRAKSRISEILEREQVRNPRDEQPLTPERIQSICAGMAYMNSVCDGAVAKDGQGFSKADSYTGKTLATAGLETEDELRCGEYILQRYPRQWQLQG